MHYSFTGIVLEQIPYSDSSIIVKLLSREEGLQSVIARGLKGKKGKSTRPLLQRMNVVEVEAFRGAKQSLGTMKSARPVLHGAGGLDAKKSSILMFINEVLCRTIKEGHHESELFDLVVKLLAVLENSESDSDLHLIFLMKLIKVFGAGPGPRTGMTPYFDLLEGVHCDQAPDHGHSIEGRECELFFKCLGTDLAIDARLGVDNIERRSLLDKILEYYSLQLDEKLELRSHKVLHIVLGET